MANPNLGELIKDRRVVIGLAGIGVAAAAGVAFMVFGNKGGDAGTDAATAPPPAAPAAANPAAPGAPPSSPGNPAAPVAAKTAQAGKPAGPPKVASSFDGAPPGFSFGGGPGGGGAAPVAAGPTAGGNDTAAAKIPLAPIKPNVQAANFRPDPFDSFRIPKYVKPPAYYYIAPLRLASRSQPKVKPPTGIPDVDFGPLPFVPRRVAGVLYNGQVSAILETGTPGQNATVEIIQPGASVTSGVSGIPNLTVALISPTQVTLRAEDGRTVSVPLTSVPAAYESAFRASVGGSDPSGGAPPPGVPGAPPPPTRGKITGGGVE